MILAEIKKAGIDLVVSLPDQWIGGLIRQIEDDSGITHIKLAREDDGVGICAGAWLGGRKAALVCQNSGVLLAVNALGAMAFHHQIPLLILAAHRGHFDDGQYYQMYKGRICEPVLQAMGLPHYVVESPSQCALVGDAARQAWLNRMPVVLLFRKKALA